jgi:dihydroorotase-like cyclic amidohydrolase
MNPNEAREFIDQKRLMESLQGEDAETLQFRHIVTAAQKVVEELGQKRSELFASGNYTDEGLMREMQNPAHDAAKKLSHLQSTMLIPRKARLEAELAKVPAPTVGSELSEMEQHRLILAYTAATGDKKNQMRAEAIRNPKLAMALVNEDPAVTGLSTKFIGELRDKLTDDPHVTERSALQRLINAAKAAETAINGANISVKRAIEAAQ